MLSPKFRPNYGTGEHEQPSRTRSIRLKAPYRLPRLPPPEPKASAGTAAVAPVELWDLVSAFGRLLRETLALQPQQITADQTPLHVYMDEVTARLGQALAHAGHSTLDASLFV